MSRGWRSVAWAAALLATGAAGCSDPMAIAANRLQVDVQLSTSRMTSGDTLGIRVLVSNPTDRTVAYDTDGCHVVVAVYDGAGRRVSPPSPACTLILLHHEFPPGASEQYEHAFFQSWIPDASDPFGFVAVPPTPDRYRVVAGITWDFLGMSKPAWFTVELPAGGD